LFLDGLDEMPSSVRSAALERLDNETANLRTVLTSRPDEYRHAIAQGRLGNTAVVEVQPVEPDAAHDYLIRDQVGEQRHSWEQVGSYLQAHPGSVAARALNNPLALSMARATYQNLNPTELIDSDRFTTVALLREHLLDRIMVSAWPDGRRRAYVTKWLAWIAHRMDTDRDLVWWDIPAFISLWQLRLAIGLGIGLPAGLAAGVPIERERGWLFGVGAGLLVLAVGLLVEFMFGFEGRFSTEPETLTLRWPRFADLRSTLEEVFEIGLVFLLVCGLAGGLIGAVLVGHAHGITILAVLWLAGVVAFGLVGAAVVGHRTALGGSGAEGAIAGAIAYGLGFGLVLALVVALPLGLVVGGLGAVLSVLKGLLQSVLWGGLIGAAFGLGFGVVAAPVDAWTAPVAKSPGLTTHATYRNVRSLSVIFGLVDVILIALLVALVSGFARPPGVVLVTSLVILVLGGLVGGLRNWLRFRQVALVKLTEFALGLSGNGRVHFLRILEDARHHQVLRQAGTVYQFRHAELQDHLAKIHGQQESAP
jgi:hypothetical protein